MASRFTENVQAQIVGTIVGGLLLSLPGAVFAGAAPLLTALFGQWGAYIIELLVGSAVMLFTLSAGYYFYLVLPGGKEPAGSLERKRYEDLRADLSRGGTAARVYSEKLTAALAAVDKFFKDAGTAGQRAFGMQRSAPLWTAASFDRCLTLALVYPVVAIFLLWAISGDVGPSESAFGLIPGLPWWQRAVSVVGLAIGTVSYWRFAHSKGPRSVLWLLPVPMCTGIMAVALAGGGAGTVAGSVGVTGAIVAAVADDIGIGVVGAVFGAVAGALAFSTAGTLAGEIVGAISVCAVGIVCCRSRITRGRKGLFLLVFGGALVVVCLAAAAILSSLASWPVVGPLLLFLGLFTLLNAPFLWFSLGLTRALLRRGLERQLWWPYFYAIVDACGAVIVIALLACALVIGIQTFDFLAVSGGGQSTLPLEALFQGITADALAPKYWWLYALFLSTMVPSIVNLVIGGLSLTRGIPRLSLHLHGLMDAGGSVPEIHRIQIASLLGMQVVIGAALGLIAQAVLVVMLFRYVMPFLGIGLLDLARAVAAFDVPGKLFALF